MKKRNVYLWQAAIVSFALAGCGDKNDKAAQASPAATTQTAVVKSECNPTTLEGCTESQKGIIQMGGGNKTLNDSAVKPNFTVKRLGS